jgi:wyosine [tRNA(Phe)-imidazoG37] synthetase (radical SAM superfamily)
MSEECIFAKMNDIANINEEVLKLQSGCIYGPVLSRRLKSSLGLNVLPRGYKLCSFNCIYCQYGLTKAEKHTIYPLREEKFPGVAEVREALVEALATAEREILYITFSGNGEATLHPQFPELVDMLIGVRDEYYPSAKTAILSNSTTIDRPEIKAALRKLDTPIMKLDAGYEGLFKKINRPADGIDFNTIVKGLTTLDHPGLIIQALIMGGPYFNATDDNIEKWAGLLKRINPLEAHIYSLDRPPALKNVLQVTKAGLEKIAQKASELSGIKVLAF